MLPLLLPNRLVSLPNCIKLYHGANARLTLAFQPTPALSIASSSSTPSLLSPSLPSEDVPSSDYLSRVTGLPLVGGALRASRAAYEQSKASSRVVKVSYTLLQHKLHTDMGPSMAPK